MPLPRPHVERASPVKLSKNKVVVLQMLAGAGAGVVTKTATAPLERVKILRQIQGMEGGSEKYTSIRQSLRLVAKEEGLLGWWRGNGANVVRVMPVYAFKFAFNDMFRQMVVPATQTSLPTMWQMLQAGTLAGLTQQLLTYPLETIRTRLTIGPAQGLHYKGIMDCGAQTVRHEGVSALYKGIVPTLVSGAPYVGLQMTGYTLLKRAMPTTDDGRSPVHVKLTAGALAGLFAQTITFPGDTIRRRMQTNGANGATRLYSSTADCIKKMWAKEGAKSFFYGWTTNCARALPGASIQFFCYDLFKQVLGVGDQ